MSYGTSTLGPFERMIGNLTLVPVFFGGWGKRDFRVAITRSLMDLPVRFASAFSRRCSPSETSTEMRTELFCIETFSLNWLLRAGKSERLCYDAAVEAARSHLLD